MSAITASASDIRPPAPSPCSARKPISSAMFWATPHSALPTRKMHDRQLQDALAAVEVAGLAVQRGADRRGQQVDRDDPGQQVLRGGTRRRWSAAPYSTMVWSSVARNIPSISPDMTTRICRCVRRRSGPRRAGGLSGSAASGIAARRLTAGATAGSGSVVMSSTRLRAGWTASARFAVGDQPLEQLDEQGRDRPPASRPSPQRAPAAAAAREASRA